MRRFVERLADKSGAVTDTITLSYDQRTRSRLRVTTDSNIEVGLFLPRGTVLNQGDLLRAEDGTIVEVRAAGETVSSASTDTPLLLNRASYHLGNRHVPLQFGPDFVRYLHDHVLDDMVRALGLKVETIQAPFEPEPGAYHRSGPVHDHG